jgi:hypothetical protein
VVRGGKGEKKMNEKDSGFKFRTKLKFLILVGPEKKSSEKALGKRLQSIYNILNNSGKEKLRRC